MLYDYDEINKIKPIYDRLANYPFDKGELYCYSIADTEKLLVFSNDKLAFFGYLVFKNKADILSKVIKYNDLISKFNFDITKLNEIIRLTSYDILKNLFDIPDEKIKEMKISSKPRSQKWFAAKEIASTHNQILKKFDKNLKQFYLSIGRVAASIYALPQTTNLSKFTSEKHYDKNIGLKIKSTNKNIRNIVFTRMQESKWYYNEIAISTIIKYISKNGREFLIDYLKNSKSKFIGDMKPNEFKMCKEFSQKFRNLFDIFRKKITER